MPKVALADTLFEWDSLLAAAAEQGAGVPSLEKHLANLRAALDRARGLEALRQRLQAERQQATQDLAATRREGDDLTLRLRELLIATFGPKWEGLIQFGVRPRRPYGRRATSRKASASSGDSTEPSTRLEP
ncbi:MAG TPA: hypothetical protein VFE33_31480 [Thermoanaerobaculia bacterium]|nr:hypothetical protein [Thermoanaerobaculia bacterium]